MFIYFFCPDRLIRQGASMPSPSPRLHLFPVISTSPSPRLHLVPEEREYGILRRKKNISFANLLVAPFFKCPTFFLFTLTDTANLFWDCDASSKLLTVHLLLVSMCLCQRATLS